METGGVREKEIFTVTAITLTHRSQHFSIPYMYHIHIVIRFDLKLCNGQSSSCFICLPLQLEENMSDEDRMDDEDAEGMYCVGKQN